MWIRMMWYDDRMYRDLSTIGSINGCVVLLETVQ